MKIYLVRHGLTDWNVEKKAQGLTDIPLNNVGLEQAEALREKIAGIDFDICYASPLLRARKTAEIAVGDRCKILFDDRLMERSFGGYEGKVVNGWAETTGVDIGDLKLNSDVGGIEPVRDVLARTKAVLDDIKTKHNKDGKILIVSHGQVSRGLNFNLVGYDDDTVWWSCEFANCEVREYEV